MKDLQIDNSWSLFLDRDGVINQKIENDYVRSAANFKFLPGALIAIKELSSIFDRILIITNQRGIGRGLYSIANLDSIHHHMLAEINKTGGRIDGIYFCPHLGSEPECNCRKPKPGMILQAKKQFPEINFRKSILVGDASSDIELGNSAAMKTVLISNSTSPINSDFVFTSLSEFSAELVK